jgi:ubiquitin-activating enzyme E1
MEPFTKKQKTSHNDIDMEIEGDSKKSDLKYENEWSRLLATIGKEAFKKLQASNVLLVGMGGLGAEIAKNIVLMGVASLTIHDTQNVSYHDLSSQFFLSEADIGKNRAEVCQTKLNELNERVQIQVSTDSLTEELIRKHTVVVITQNNSRDELIHINNICHSHNISFIAGDVNGLFGWSFVDFCTFECLDPDGEQPKTSFISGITQEEEGIISVDNKRHDFIDDEFVKITEVKGMTEVNGQIYKVKNKGPYQISIGDTRNFSPYVNGGHVEQVKVATKHEFNPLSDYFGKPIPADKIVLGDFSKFDRTQLYPYYLQSLLLFKEKHNRYPIPGSETEAEEILKQAQVIAKDSDPNLEFKEETAKWMISLAKGASGILSPMSTIFGGIIGQEIIKAVSSKYTPLKQFLFFDATECLPENITESDCAPLQCRYDSQIAVFGKTYNEKLTNLNYFLIGAGAIGCEILKCWAMMGVGCGPSGKIVVTDMDTIEISNLNRQFLYRPWNVNGFKSKVAAEAAKKMNPSMNIDSWTVRVGPDTEDTFDLPFWERLSGVCNALDNLKARLYVDEKCVFHKKSLLESGTSGTKGNVQVVVPRITESYGSSVDPPTAETPVCLLHSFPNNIEHCLQWGRELIFEGHFVKEPEITNNYIAKENYLETLSQNLKLPTLEILDRTIINRIRTFEQCVHWARNLFEELYVNKINQLLHNFPLDYVDQHGTPFWSSSKRPPTPIQYDPNNELHLDFIVAATFLKAYTSRLIPSELKPEDFEQKVQLIKEYSTKVDVVRFVPKKVKINTDENVKEETPEYTDEDDIKSREILKRLPPSKEAKEFEMKVISFEKDDDNNFHIDFIHAASNLRAIGYGIKSVTRLESKLIAGKIIPAIVTTTAAVVGFVNLELYKLFAGDKKITDFRNTFINLALPFFGQVEPLPPAQRTYGKNKFTLWDRIDIRAGGDITLAQVLKIFEEKHKVTVDMLGVGSALIYASWMATKSKERLPKKLTQVVQEITGKPLPPGRYLMLEPTGVDEDGVEIEDLPRVCYWY